MPDREACRAALNSQVPALPLRLTPQSLQLLFDTGEESSGNTITADLSHISKLMVSEVGNTKKV